MCRLFARIQDVQDSTEFLNHFAHGCKSSREYQGHGWGIIYFDGSNWQIYKNIEPIWTFDFSTLPKMGTFMVHARSAYKDEGIQIENNMPFENERYAFIFNGELQGVKIKATGRIGAEKLFNFILRFTRYPIIEAIQRAINVVEKKSEHIRAANFIILDKLTHKFYVYSQFHSEKDYFTLLGNDEMISSIPLNYNKWIPIPQREVIIR